MYKLEKSERYSTFLCMVGMPNSHVQRIRQCFHHVSLELSWSTMSNTMPKFVLAKYVQAGEE